LSAAVLSEIGWSNKGIFRLFSAWILPKKSGFVSVSDRFPKGQSDGIHLPALRPRLLSRHAPRSSRATLDKPVARGNQWWRGIIPLPRIASESPEPRPNNRRTTAEMPATTRQPTGEAKAGVPTFAFFGAISRKFAIIAAVCE
jgi:hypothetical protein